MPVHLPATGGGVRPVLISQKPFWVYASDLHGRTVLAATAISGLNVAAECCRVFWHCWPHTVTKIDGDTLKGTANGNLMSFQLPSTPIATRSGLQLR